LLTLRGRSIFRSRPGPARPTTRLTCPRSRRRAHPRDSSAGVGLQARLPA
jgi:hypothetical protein